MEALIDKLNSLNTASAEAVSVLKDLFFKVDYKKGSILGSSQRPAPAMLHYIGEGMARGTVNYNGSVHLLWVMETGFLIPPNGFLSDDGLGETVQFLENSVVYSLDISMAEQLAENNSNLYKMLLEIYEQSIYDGRKRELMLRLETSGQRMDYIRETSGDLIYHADRKTSASYLKIGTRQFNRLKSGK